MATRLQTLTERAEEELGENKIKAMLQPDIDELSHEIAVEILEQMSEEPLVVMTAPSGSQYIRELQLLLNKGVRQNIDSLNNTASLSPLNGQSEPA